MTLLLGESILGQLRGKQTVGVDMRSHFPSARHVRSVGPFMRWPFLQVTVAFPFQVVLSTFTSPFATFGGAPQSTTVHTKRRQARTTASTLDTERAFKCVRANKFCSGQRLVTQALSHSAEARGDLRLQV